MSKSAITRLFLAGAITVVAGIVVATVAVAGMFAGGMFVMNGPDVVGVDPSTVSWSMLSLMILGGLAVFLGWVFGMVAWVGALINTARLEDKAWFVLLLVLGLLSFGLIAMIAYVIAGPDNAVEGTARPPLGAGIPA